MTQPARDPQTAAEVRALAARVEAKRRARDGLDSQPVQVRVMEGVHKPGVRPIRGLSLDLIEARRIIAATAHVCGVDIADITGPGLTRSITDARGIARALICRRTELAQARTARELGERARTGVERRANQVFNNPKKYLARLYQIEKALGQTVREREGHHDRNC